MATTKPIEVPVKATIDEIEFTEQIVVAPTFVDVGHDQWVNTEHVTLVDKHRATGRTKIHLGPAGGVETDLSPAEVAARLNGDS